MTVLLPSVDRVAASEEALATLPGYANHEPGTDEFAVLDPSTEERIATLPSYTPEYAIEQVGVADRGPGGPGRRPRRGIVPMSCTTRTRT